MDRKNDMTNEEIARNIRYKLFADRDSIKEAVDYAFEVFRRLGPDGEIAATTAMMVVLNTLSNKILENEGVKS